MRRKQKYLKERKKLFEGEQNKYLKENKKKIFEGKQKYLKESKKYLNEYWRKAKVFERK